MKPVLQTGMGARAAALAAITISAISVDAATTSIKWGFTCSSNEAGCCSDAGYCDTASKTVTVGDTVEWTSVGGHNIVSGASRVSDTKFSSPWLTSGSSFSHTFEEAGEYPYYCSPHGGMNAKITVLAALAENTPNPTRQPTGSPSSQTTQPTQTLTAAKYTVVGAGPGGVLAAHILSKADPDSTLRLLERGGLPIAETYTAMFASSYNRQPSFPAATYNGVDIDLAGVFGGQQTTNGGVYAPGTASDLAAALGIDVSSAAASQSCAGQSIDWTPEPPKQALAAGRVPSVEQQTLGSENSKRWGYLAQCAATDDDGCAWGDMLFAPTEIRRRTVAHKLHGVASSAADLPTYASLETNVERLVFEDDAADELVATAVVFEDGTVSPVDAGGAVVLAAGAMGSISILARSSPGKFGSFSKLHNHFYLVAYAGPMYNQNVSHTDQWFTEFTTPGSTPGAAETCAGQKFELQMNGNFPVADGLVQMVVLQMEPEMRGTGEYSAVNRTLTISDVPTNCDLLARSQAADIVEKSWGVVDNRTFGSTSWFPQAPWGQAWHWAGGIPLTQGSSKVDGIANVYSGDTAALRNPFSCHTSMPSAAAGVVAAMQVLGKPVAECSAYVPASPSPTTHPTPTPVTSGPTGSPTPGPTTPEVLWTCSTMPSFDVNCSTFATKREVSVYTRALRKEFRACKEEHAKQRSSLVTDGKWSTAKRLLTYYRDNKAQFKAAKTKLRKICKMGLYRNVYKKEEAEKRQAQEKAAKAKAEAPTK